MKDFILEDWRPTFKYNDLNTFQDFWEFEADWFEEPNIRRGGWSGVMRAELKSPDESERVIFLKRQENHVTKTFKHPIKGKMTFEVEMKALMQLRAHGIPTLEPLYYAQRTIDGDRRALLITQELAGYISLEDLTNKWIENGWAGPAERKRVIQSVAGLMRSMHKHKLQHNCFYPKHILLKFEGDEIDVRIIDLEKVKRRWFRSTATLRDLYTLNRHLHTWPLTDKVRFLLIYMEIPRLNSLAKQFWKKIAKRTIRKNKLA